MCQLETIATGITDHNALGFMGHDDCALTQMKWGISQTISLVGVSAMAQQQLHYRQKKNHQKD